MAKNLQVVFGNLGKTSATAVAYSKSATAISLIVNGKSFPITMAAVGADRPANDANGEIIAGYVGAVNVTGLEPYTLQEWSATQSSDTDSGSFTTNGTRGQNCSIAVTTCFSSTDNYGGLNAWQFLEAYMKQTPEYPMMSIVHLDDIFYADGALSAAQDGDSCAQGKTINSISWAGGAKAEYDYACWYLTWANILDGWDNGLDAAEANPSWEYCLTHTCFMPQWGDHEIANNIWEVDLTSVPNPFHETLNGYDGKALNVYNAMMKPLQGTAAQNADTEANHWYADFCGIRVIAPDPITKSVPTVAMYGANQITDLLNTVDSQQPFKLMANPAMSGRIADDSLVANTNNYKSENFVRTEWDRVYVESGKTPKSLMDNPQTNGQVGNMVVTRGDWHSGLAYHYSAPASSGKAKENYTEVCLRTVNGSAPTSTYHGDAEAAAMAAGNVEVVGSMYPPSVLGGNPVVDKHVTIMVIEYTGDRATPETVVRLWHPLRATDGSFDQEDVFHGGKACAELDDSKGIIWGCSYERKFRQYNDNNRGFAIDEEPPYELSTFSGGALGAGT